MLMGVSNTLPKGLLCCAVLGKGAAAGCAGIRWVGTAPGSGQLGDRIHISIGLRLAAYGCLHTGLLCVRHSRVTEGWVSVGDS